MSRFLRRAAIAAAAAGGLSCAVSWTTSSPFPLFRLDSPSSCPSTPNPAAASTGDAHLALVRHAALLAAADGYLSSAASRTTSSPVPLFRFGSLSSSPSTRDLAAATTGDGHLALISAHPRLRELNAMLTNGSFLVDATQALLAAALRHAPFYPETLRQGRDLFAAQIQSEDSDGGAEKAASARMNMAFLDARDGRHEEALEALARLAAERPGHTAPRLHIFAAALCYLLGRPEEGSRWLRDAAVPDLSRGEHKRPFLEAVMIASQGRTPRGAGDSAEELVLLTLHGMVEFAMWSVFKDGDLSERIQVLALMAFLRGAVARGKLHGDDAPPSLEGSQDAKSPQAS